MYKKRVLIIGLDGFTWQVGSRLIQEGLMPTLAGLQGKGCYGNLRSVVPYETSAAWSSFQTGCLPGKTGVFTFHSFHRSNNKILLNSFDDILVPSIWELASQAGRRIVSINMPITSPPPKAEGIIIPGLMCPRLSPDTVYPPEAYHQYLKSAPHYRIVDQTKRDSLQGYVDQAVCTEQVRCDLSLQIMKETDWDLFSVEMQSTDFFQHRNWWALDPSARGYSEKAFLTASVFYSKIDMMIKQLVEAAGEETLTCIVSDHGFCIKHAEIRINSWLAEHGYLSIRATEPKKMNPFKEKLKKKVPVAKEAAKLYGTIIRSISFQKKNISSKLHAEALMKHAREIVDLENTSAFCLGGMAGLLYINTQKEHFGERLIEELLASFGPESSNPLIAAIERADNFYGLKKAYEHFPDYVISLYPGVVNHIEPIGPIVTTGDFEGKQTGTHALDGVFLMAGPDILEGHQTNATIVDIAPTILSYMGVSVPDYMDGNVMKSAFKTPPETSYLHRDIEDVARKKGIYSEEQQSEVEKQLRDLGYL
jgi:predicted AlkP superfamily phosphohydrolase/phosphomutase